MCRNSNREPAALGVAGARTARNLTNDDGKTISPRRISQRSCSSISSPIDRMPTRWTQLPVDPTFLVTMPAYIRPIRSALLYIIVCPTGAFSFTGHESNLLASPISRHLQTSTPRPITHLHSLIDSNTENGGDVQVEIWLDLRDTAILPQAALEHMNENQWITDDDTTSSSMIDRILISGSDVAQVVKQMSREDEENIPETLYVDKQDQTIRSIEDVSHVLGGVVSLKDDEFADPLPALDIMSKGGWVVIDSEEIIDEDKRDEAIGGLVDFLAAGASSSASSSSLLLGVDRSDQGGDTEEGVEAGNKGGIALKCTNKNDVLRAGSYSQSVASSGSLTTTDGGILIQSNADDVASSLKIAVAVPFDAMLWKAAAVVFQRGDDE